ncbi:murein hydrolase activator EnvC family protein [Agromyces archimandritae]|uniref:M23 family metallopeptidase n=1 Tax=Agromyces archimandritae TaxID=2781962 RepID=A0A975FLU9_9MICO|nr:M23 family metallopeptidase [Agromyces archimandritae]QTX04495.1 M23 family metallopeptidase [Agromyces archimandritae]
MPPTRIRRLIASAPLAALLVLAVPSPAHAVPLGAPAVDAAGDWIWPITPVRIVAPYRAPETRYAAGHRGVDLASAPGDGIRSPADGVVSFAGTVVDRAVVTVDTGDGVLVSMEPVLSALPAGTAVGRGQPLGVVADGGHCDGSCVHLGVRVDGDYVSPLRFLGGIPRSVLLPQDPS